MPEAAAAAGTETETDPRGSTVGGCAHDLSVCWSAHMHMQLHILMKHSVQVNLPRSVRSAVVYERLPARRLATGPRRARRTRRTRATRLTRLAGWTRRNASSRGCAAGRDDCLQHCHDKAGGMDEMPVSGLPTVNVMRHVLIKFSDSYPHSRVHNTQRGSTPCRTGAGRMPPQATFEPKRSKQLSPTRRVK